MKISHNLLVEKFKKVCEDVAARLNIHAKVWPHYSCDVVFDHTHEVYFTRFNELGQVADCRSVTICYDDKDEKAHFIPDGLPSVDLSETGDPSFCETTPWYAAVLDELRVEFSKGEISKHVEVDNLVYTYRLVSGELSPDDALLVESSGQPYALPT